MVELAYGFLLARRALVFAGLLVAFCCSAWAQSDATPAPPPPGQHWRGPGVERELDHLTRILSLTPEQQTQVKTLLTSQRQQMEALRAANASAEPGPPSPEQREKMTAIRKDTDDKITALLTDEQKPKFAAWQQQRQQMMERRGGPGGPPPADAPQL
jgi:periplasmic protein CpxP/Spy